MAADWATHMTASVTPGQGVPCAFPEADAAAAGDVGVAAAEGEAGGGPLWPALPGCDRAGLLAWGVLLPACGAGPAGAACLSPSCTCRSRVRSLQGVTGGKKLPANV